MRQCKLIKKKINLQRKLLNLIIFQEITGCAASGCAGIAGCVACVTAIAASCGQCAYDVCYNSKSMNASFGVSAELTCQISPSVCDFHCRCLYSKSGSCRNGTCYCN